MISNQLLSDADNHPANPQTWGQHKVNLCLCLTHSDTLSDMSYVQTRLWVCSVHTDKADQCLDLPLKKMPMMACSQIYFTSDSYIRPVSYSMQTCRGSLYLKTKKDSLLSLVWFDVTYFPTPSGGSEGPSAAELFHLIKAHQMAAQNNNGACFFPQCRGHNSEETALSCSIIQFIKKHGSRSFVSITISQL